jgi:hypothetical protein
LEKECFYVVNAEELPRRQLERPGQFCTEVCQERTLGREAEESPLLETVAREWLVKTQQDGKGLAGAVVICELCGLAVAL